MKNNYFRTELANLGVARLTLGASLAVEGAGEVTYYYCGKEAAYRNDFLTDACHTCRTTLRATRATLRWSELRSVVSTGSGLLDFKFCAYSSGAKLQGCVTNEQNVALGILSFQSIAFSIAGNEAWLHWDDSGAGPDDDYEDMLIKAVFKPAEVPEPGRLALFGLGLLGLGVAARRNGQRSCASHGARPM